MNLPNKLTVLRVLMIPAFVALYLVQSYFWALALFGLAAITDALDGLIARKYRLVTDFGALMDPLADKLLVMAAMLCFLASSHVSAPIVIVLLSREFLVTSIRLVAVRKGTVISADKWGKLKTVLQMIWIMVGLLLLWLGSIDWLVAIVDGGWVAFNALTWLVMTLTVLSGLNYIVKNRHLINDA
ncbi:MAG: CDP-diacylglycerol--glycerol-3-phosphate 3-phosphatidyltransferase [Oscillospiraceae bacterium]|nr:CDP-diacylglycerol--glycerol-3-phosphate 3-phosphatidyltransferase [Oscillospiraceae bacterium]